MTLLEILKWIMLGVLLDVLWRDGPYVARMLWDLFVRRS